MGAQSEKTTDFMVFTLLRAAGYVDGAFNPLVSGLQIWTGLPDDARVKKCLLTASKRKTGRVGYPDLIAFDARENLVLVFEHKSDAKKHVYMQDMREKVDDYAVNGTLWYASFLKDSFDVVAFGVSGARSDELLIDAYVWRKGAESFTNLNCHEVHAIDEYRKLVSPSQRDVHDAGELGYLTSQAKEFNNYLRDYMGVHEGSRLYVLGSILAALEDPGFKMSYSFYNDDASLSAFLFQTIDRRLKPSNIFNYDEVIAVLKPALCGLAISGKAVAKNMFPSGVLLELVRRVDNLLFEYWRNSEVDLISLFFNVFLSYSTAGGSDLGIVLTPSHITKFFVDLADVGIDSKVVDVCAGTGGFLTASWKRILLGEDYTKEQKERYRLNNLLGVEKEPAIYAVLALNMFLHKDGKTKIYNSDCFGAEALNIQPHCEWSIKDWLKDFEGNVGFINPPYSDELYPELEFVELLLDVLLPSSTAVAILPVNSVSSQSKKHSNLTEVKRRILGKHTLVASIQMPTQLFYPKGVETVVLVFKTGYEHTGETWMAKFDDGFELMKHQKTRTPTYRSEGLYQGFLQAYRDKAEGKFSFNKQMSADDQWLYLLHKPFEYEIGDDDLQDKVNNYLAYLVSNRYPIISNDDGVESFDAPVFEYVKLVDAFGFVDHAEIDKMRVSASVCKDRSSVPYVGRSKANNGVTDYVIPDPSLVNEPGVLTVALDGSTGSTFYQHHRFETGQNVHILEPKDIFSTFSPLVALYTAVSMEGAFCEYTWNVGLTKKRLQSIMVKMPMCNGKVDVAYIEGKMRTFYNAGLVSCVADDRLAD